MPRIVPSQLRRFIAGIPLIVLLTPLSPALAQQKPAAPSRPPQAQLEDRVKGLEGRLNAVEQKAASAAIEKDYITRVQKQYETYYEKVLSTQNWTLAIFGFFLTAVFALAAIFSIDIFDSRTKSALDAALAQVEKRLGDQNSAQLKALEDGLKKLIGEQTQDLQTRSDYQFHVVRGLAAAVNESYDAARRLFRSALAIYKTSKARQLIPRASAATAARNILVSFRHEDEASSLANAKEELADELYNDLEDELALAAVDLDWLGPLLKERKAVAPPAAE